MACYTANITFCILRNVSCLVLITYIQVYIYLSLKFKVSHIAPHSFEHEDVWGTGINTPLVQFNSEFLVPGSLRS